MFNATRIGLSATRAVRVPLVAPARTQRILAVRFNSTTPDGHKTGGTHNTGAKHDPRVTDPLTVAERANKQRQITALVLLTVAMLGSFAWMGGFEAAVEDKEAQLVEMEKLREEAWAAQAWAEREQSSRPS